MTVPELEVATGSLAQDRLASGRAPLLLFATSHVYGRRQEADEVADLSFALARILVETAQRHGLPKAAHLALPEYFASRAELLSEFEVDDGTPIVFFSLRSPEDHRYLKGADVGYYVDIQGDYVGDHALGASLPSANLAGDDLLQKFVQYCPRPPSFPLDPSHVRLPIKHKLAMSKLQVRLLQQRAQDLRVRNLLVVQPNLDEITRLGFVLDLASQRLDVALNLLVVYSTEDGHDDPVGDALERLAERHPGVVPLQTLDIELGLMAALRDLGFELFSTGYRCRHLFENALSQLIGLRVITQDFDGTYEPERQPLWSRIRLDQVLA
jgi:hypothetical protein